MQRSVGLSPDVIEFVEEHRGAFSFSAFIEYLIREGIVGVTGEERSGDGRDAKKRKAVIRVR